jgi:thiosulfate/3-mercaptopyruvate sulfurtransferase
MFAAVITAYLMMREDELMSLYPLVTTEWLDANRLRDDVRIVDIRGHVIPASMPKPHYFSHREDYDAAHVPGAVFVDWVRDITVNGAENSRLASPEAFAAQMGALGIGDGTLVVAYDDAGGMFAARLWWALQYYGHDRVVVVDGGWHKWTAEGRPVTAEVPQVTPVTFTARPRPHLFRDADQVEARDASSAHLIDVRSPAEFEGRESRAVRAGHIPGAINLPRADLITPEGLTPDADSLRAMFAAAGVTGEDGGEIVFYCNGGVSASYGLLAYRVAGFAGGAVYDGSWKDWGNDPARPIA